VLLVGKQGLLAGVLLMAVLLMVLSLLLKSLLLEGLQLVWVPQLVRMVGWIQLRMQKQGQQ